MVLEGVLFLQKQEQEKQGKTLVKDFIKILFVMYLVTFVLLLLLAFALFRLDITELVTKIWLIAIYIISGFTGGFLIGKKAKSKKFLWGFFIGLSYFILLFAVSLLLYRGLSQDIWHLLTTMVLCVAAATVGGMVS